MLTYNMPSFENLTIEKSKMLSKAWIGSYENLPRQQLKRIFTKPSTPKPTPGHASKPKKPTIFLKPKNMHQPQLA